MVEMHQETVNGIEVIHAHPAGKHHQPLPTLFFYHGYTSSKEVYSYFGYALANAGCRVILPDALMHGARFDGDEQRRLDHFWPILLNNIDELPALCDHYRHAGLIDGQRVGIGGASMGGMTALGASVRYPWLRACAALMGAGDFVPLSESLFPPPANADQQAQRQQLRDRLAQAEVFHQLDKLAGRALLLWHGQSDPLVPALHSARLYQALCERQLDQQVEYLTEPGIGHKITVQALAATQDFFRRQL